MTQSEHQNLSYLQCPYGPTSSAPEQSNYMACVDGEMVRLLDRAAPSERVRFIHAQLRDFIVDDRYPCVGARAAFNTEHYRFGVYETIATPASNAGLARDLRAFVAEQRYQKTEYATFLAIFDQVDCASEKIFETRLWAQLQALHDLDPEPYSNDVSSDPSNPRFGFSYAGVAFFIVGMHPGSSRLARRFAFPTLVFNSRSQFDELRNKGQYERFAEVVREREIALQGSLNPNLAEFGERSEARQYAGRAITEDWKCPFRP